MLTSLTLCACILAQNVPVAKKSEQGVISLWVNKSTKNVEKSMICHNSKKWSWKTVWCQNWSFFSIKKNFCPRNFSLKFPKSGAWNNCNQRNNFQKIIIKIYENLKIVIRGVFRTQFKKALTVFSNRLHQRCCLGSKYTSAHHQSQNKIFKIAKNRMNYRNKFE